MQPALGSGARGAGGLDLLAAALLENGDSLLWTRASLGRSLLPQRRPVAGWRQLRARAVPLKLHRPANP